MRENAEALSASPATMWTMDVLLVEDDDSIAEPLAEGLRREGFEVERVATGAEALAAAEPDLVLLDLRLPDIDGFTVCRELRARSDVPIIVVSARGEEVDRVVGLELGADDYVVKPFGLRELSRASARSHGEHGSRRDDSDEIVAGALRIDLRAHRVARRRQRGAADGEGVRPARRARPRRRRGRRPRAASCARSGTRRGTARRRRSTCTSPRCAASSAIPALIETVRGIGLRLAA